MTLKVTLVVTLAAALSACSTMTVNTDHDPEARFAELESYAWLPRPERDTGDPRVDDNPLLETRIRTAVDRTLASKGFRQESSGAPDFLVGYHVTLDQKTSVTVINDYYRYSPGWGYRYGARYRPYRAYGYSGPPETYVHQYDVGTLIVDVVLPEERRLIWRGAASYWCT